MLNALSIPDQLRQIRAWAERMAYVQSDSRRSLTDPGERRRAPNAPCLKAYRRIPRDCFGASFSCTMFAMISVCEP
jgi:hypothetical protein